MLINEQESLGRLRSIEDSELELMLSWRNTPSIRNNMYTTHEIPLREHLIWWECVKASSEHQYFMYESEGVPYGIVGFSALDNNMGSAYWAFYAAPDAPKGTGSKMELLALDCAFFDLGLKKLCCEVLAFNKAVLKLHQKFGFQVESVFEDRYARDGRFLDVYLLVLESDSWKERRSHFLEKLVRISRR